MSSHLPRLLPISILLYVLAFLDRANIGNAKIYGLTKDLHISPPAYNTALALYFIAYLIFDVPANVSRSILKRFDPRFWFPLITFACGVTSVAQGLVTNEAGLFGIRFLLGVTEAGLFSGVVFIFSVYYPRRERHWRVAVFFSGAALAGAFGGILAYSIGKMEGLGGKRGWQWIFILEGLITIAISAGAIFVVPTWPQEVKWLTDVELSRLLARLGKDDDAAEREKFAWNYVRQAFVDPLVWGYALLFHCFAFAFQTLSLFLPTIITDLGFATWKAQLLTVPPYLLASMGIAFGAWSTVRTGRRAPFVIGSSIVAIFGYVVLIPRSNYPAAAQYVGVHFATLGVYTGVALLLSWPSENISGQTKRAVGVAMQITIGNLSGLAGVLLYRPAFSAHRFRMPHMIAIGYLTSSIVIASALWYFLASENRRRAEIISAGKDEEVGHEAKVLLGDREIHWRYCV
ncbi:major facilitator superfamily domain-containing protein [Russula compacta]|nr:major facilitator superfamily domain-containing protein [Russula compacta]